MKKWASKIRSPKTTSEDRVFDFEQFQAKANEAKSSDEEEMTENQKAFFKPLYMKSKDKPQPKRGPGRPRKNPAENEIKDKVEPKKRGRPKKTQATDDPNSGKNTTSAKKNDRSIRSLLTPKSVTSKKNDSKKAEESTDDEIGPYLSRNPIDDVSDFIDNNLLDNSIKTFNGDDVTSEVMSPPKSRIDCNEAFAQDKESSNSDESLIESSLKKKSKRSRFNISFLNNLTKENSSKPKGDKESGYICDAISQNIIKEKVYQSAIGYDLDPLPNMKFIGIVDLP